MSARWDIDADSPLLPLAEGGRRRARFTLPLTVAGGPPAAVGTGLLAGATEVDITPPPGLPKAGYSRNAHAGAGFRTRLRARILHLRSGTGSVALVQCDLLGGSAVVHRLVARAVAEETDVPAAGLYLGATHTHGGPGQFLGTDFYNRFASNRPGFDAAWTQFLATRIAAGVRAAVAARRPARCAGGTTEVWGLTRNRSLASYVRNDGLADRRAAPQRAYVTVDGRLHVLRVDALAPDGGTTPLAALLTFPVHGTGVPMRSDLYNADVWAYVTGEMAARVERSHGTRPVVGAVEGPHADVAPALRPGRAGDLEAERIGRGIGAAAADLYGTLDGRLTDRVPLACGWRDLDLDRVRSAGGVTLPRRPAVGAALVAGAFENETPVIHRLPPFRPGRPRRRPRGPHGVKHVLGGPLQRLVLPLRSFPRVVPVQVVRVGPVALVGLPFELTTETGRRIEAAVGAATRGHGVDRVVVTSVANEYAGYCTTAEEYGEQRYEGGHTLYGPTSQAFFTAAAARLAGETVRDGLVDDLVPDRAFDLAQRRYLARAEGSDVDRALAGPATFTDATAATDPAWRLDWWDVSPGRLAWHEPLVRVEMQDGPGAPWVPAVAHGRPVDDGGCDVEVRHAGTGGDRGHAYTARWWSPGFRAGRRHRFVLVANTGRPEVASDPFD
ncbi:MAG TPA: neutral/alkaline non-lysosomal ceramidase N-terminal domain-containing protein [Acidimicrobiales bacterium]|nr:neutral/alkaline non-lysosomal ceramidase N-terminal domain-containing protein [Acidimicrobiales bacterium]